MAQCPFNEEITTCGMILDSLEKCLDCGTWLEYKKTHYQDISFRKTKVWDNQVYITKDGLVSTTPPDKISEFDTGAIRSSDENKTLWDLIPVECLERLAIKYTDGAKIYGKNNWKKGIPTERYVGGALRHFMQWRLGKRDEDHLAAVVFNIFGIMFNELQDKQYPYGGEDEQER